MMILKHDLIGPSHQPETQKASEAPVIHEVCHQGSDYCPIICNENQTDE